VRENNITDVQGAINQLRNPNHEPVQSTAPSSPRRNQSVA
jgi:hypothetical protein